MIAESVCVSVWCVCGVCVCVCPHLFRDCDEVLVGVQ